MDKRFDINVRVTAADSYNAIAKLIEVLEDQLEYPNADFVVNKGAVLADDIDELGADQADDPAGPVDDEDPKKDSAEV